jgi:hypothetical protein
MMDSLPRPLAHDLVESGNKPGHRLSAAVLIDVDGMIISSALDGYMSPKVT